MTCGMLVKGISSEQTMKKNQAYHLCNRVKEFTVHHADYMRTFARPDVNLPSPTVARATYKGCFRETTWFRRLTSPRLGKTMVREHIFALKFIL